jgi:hypothetical protein
MSAHTPGALTPHGEKVQRVINLLLASSCFGRAATDSARGGSDVCGAPPCACAETLVQHFEINADLLAALQAMVAAGSPSPYATPGFDARTEVARAAIAKATGAT